IRTSHPDAEAFSTGAAHEQGHAGATERHVPVLAEQARTVRLEREDPNRSCVLLRGDVPNGPEANRGGERPDALARRVANRTNRAVFLDDVQVRRSSGADSEHSSTTGGIEGEPPRSGACPFVTERFGRLIQVGPGTRGSGRRPDAILGLEAVRDANQKAAVPR